MNVVTIIFIFIFIGCKIMLNHLNESFLFCLLQTISCNILTFELKIVEASKQKKNLCLMVNDKRDTKQFI